MKKPNLDIRDPYHFRSEKEERIYKPKTDSTNRFFEKTKSNGRNRSKYSSNSSNYFGIVPPLTDTKKNDIENAVKEKLRLCSILFNFNNSERIEEKLRKERTLIEISEFVQHLTAPIPDYIYVEIPRMVGCNVFRTLAPFHPIVTVGMEDEEEFQLIESWPHLQYVYEIMLRFLEHPHFDIKKCRSSIDHTFIKYLLELFDSPDPRERDYLKTILHRIYGKMINLRAFTRKHINNIFFTFIYETERHNGIAELLEILGSIINGFQVPLKEEHKVFLKHVLMPLHKTKGLNQYHPQLAYCILEFIKKDKNLISYIIVDGLIKFWPKMHSFKELMFLNELEECLEICDKDQFKKILKPLFLQLSKCVSSSNFQVCERTLYLWTNVEIVDLMSQNIREILPLIFPALYNSKQHWNKQIHSMVFNALKVMMEMDQVLFDEYTSQFKETRNKEKQQLQNKNEKWNKMFLKAKKNPLFKKYSSSILSSSSVSVVPEDENKNVKEIGVEIKKKITAEEIMKNPSIPKLSSSSATVKTPDVKQHSKDSYLFKN